MTAPRDARSAGRLTRIRRRRNTLRSRLHTVHELFAALLVLGAFGLPAVGLLVGNAHAAQEMDARRRAMRTDHRVDGVLRQNVYTVGNALAGGRGVTAAVAWTADDGSPRTGEADVTRTGRVGDTTTIWLDPAGNPTAPPAERGTIAAEAVSVGVLAALGGAGVLLVLYAAENTAFMRMRMAAWARDWARTAPDWQHTA